MTFAAHDRSGLFFLVASLALQMVNVYKGNGVVAFINGMAFRTFLAFGRIIFNEFPILIYMMTRIAFIKLCLFIVLFSIKIPPIL